VPKGFFATGVYYVLKMATRPQTRYGLNDSPASFAAWLINHGDDHCSSNPCAEPQGKSRSTIGIGYSKGIKVAIAAK